MKIKVLASGSNGNCYILTDMDNNQLLLECGIKYEKIVQFLLTKLSAMCYILFMVRLCARQFNQIQLNHTIEAFAEIYSH